MIFTYNQIQSCIEKVLIFLKAFLGSIQSVAVIIGLIYITVNHWYELNSYRIKKDSTSEDKIEISILPKNIYNNFRITAILISFFISFTASSYIFQEIPDMAIFLISFYILFFLIFFIIEVFILYKQPMNQELYIKKSALGSSETKFYVYVNKDSEDKFIFKLVSNDNVPPEYISISKLEIYNCYWKNGTKEKIKAEIFNDQQS